MPADAAAAAHLHAGECELPPTASIAGALSGLTALSLAGSSVDDEGLRHLMRLTRLCSLDASFCKKITVM